MLHFTTPSPERFSALAPDPAEDLKRLRRHLVRGTVRPEHLVVATTDDGTDLGRLGLYTHPDSVTVAYAQRIVPDGTNLADIYGALFDGIASAARSTALALVEVTVVDADESAPEVKRAALTTRGWEIDGDRLELEAGTVPGATSEARPDGRDEIVDIDPFDPRVVRVMAAAMSDSLDHYDRTQVALLGPEAAATAYRDMMTEGSPTVPWLAHRASSPSHGTGDIVGIAAIQAFPTDWSLGYLAVDPQARKAGVGTALVCALLGATAAAGVPLATASVDTANPRIRGTLEKAGFSVRSARTDFVLRLVS